MPWEYPLVGRTRMLSEALLAAGRPTTFVEAAVLHPLKNIFRSIIDGLPAHVVRPSRPARIRDWPDMDEQALQSSIQRAARELRRRLDGCVDWPATVAIVVTPAWAPWLSELPFGRVFYDCIDHLSVHCPTPRHVELYTRWERMLVQRASAAVVTAESLAAHLRTQRNDLPIELIRNGVDVRQFDPAVSGARPADLPDGRIIGFVGALYDWVDFGLIANVAQTLSDFQFVFVGPAGESADVARLRGISNVHLLGARSYDDVPAYVRAFDVCWLPFVAGDVASATNPIKLYEYLAMGKPAVSTRVADLDSFRGLVRVATTAAEMVEQLRAAFGDTADVDRRIAFARMNSWQQRAEHYSQFAESLFADAVTPD